MLATALAVLATLPSIPGVREWHPGHGAAVRPAQVVAELGSSDRRLGSEGYALELGPVVRIQARTRAGLFYGRQTLRQLLRAGHGKVPVGRARDWPSYPERGLMVDNGRRYYSPAWLRARIRELAYLKLNQLHLHFSDNQGFRIESDSHPEAVTRPYLTKRQVRDLIAYARRRHVRVIPELDMPGHMQAALAAHPELQVAGHPDELDFTKPAARRFARDLILEYMELFGGRYWHAGADEFSGPGDFIGFVNWIDRLVRAHHETLRVWHDGVSKPGLRRDVIVEWWADHAGPSPKLLLRRGHRILNAGWWPTYYDVGPLGQIRPSMKVAYDTWQVNLFGGLAINTPTPAGPLQRVPARGVLGSELHVWNDDPSAETVAQTARGIAPGLRVIAQKTWGGPPPARTYAGFERLWRRVRP